MNGNVASGTLLVLVGVWLLLQTLAGDLPRRLLSLAGVAGSGGTSSAWDPSNYRNVVPGADSGGSW